METYSNETTTRLIEKKDSLELSLASWSPWRLTNPSRKRAAQAEMDKVKTELYKRRRNNRY